MTPSTPRPIQPLDAPPGSALSRRRFLATVGLVAAAGALAPILRRVGARAMSSVEAGRPLLGTWVRVVARHPDRERARRAVDRAFAAFRDVDRQMSVHRADSDLARLNRSAGIAPARVPAALLEVIAQADACARRSGGLYDVTVLPLMTLYGFYGPERATMPTTREVDAALAVTGWEGVTIDRAAGTVSLARRGMGIDLGSIGKGWAIDRAVEAMRAEGVASGLVDAGGNVYGLGVPDEGAKGWPVALFHPLTGRTVHVWTLRDQAVATSANNERFRVIAGHRCGHLMNARHGLPADGHVSATVLARSGLESDHNSTTAFLLGPSRFRNWPGVLETRFL
ncbi:MAG TPA: FAD:protein FMN transferase [Terriglobales bacterium]|nr:FAD:protein FMN transferase [Terriglobales bacterium]